MQDTGVPSREQFILRPTPGPITSIGDLEITYEATFQCRKERSKQRAEFLYPTLLPHLKKGTWFNHSA